MSIDMKNFEFPKLDFNFQYAKKCSESEIDHNLFVRLKEKSRDSLILGLILPIAKFKLRSSNYKVRITKFGDPL